MKVTYAPDHCRVEVSRDEVAEFALRWPCFGRVRAIAFTFDAWNHDLTDIEGKHVLMDDEGVSALCDIAKAYAFAGSLCPTVDPDAVCPDGATCKESRCVAARAAALAGADWRTVLSIAQGRS